MSSRNNPISAVQKKRTVATTRKKGTVSSSKPPSGYDIHGIDISHYQGKIDWGRLLQNKQTATPLHFIFMKATEGGDHNDTTFEANFVNARNHGFIRGAYHFYIPGTDALKQADFFIRTVKLDSGDLPPVLDVEVTGRKEKKELQQGILMLILTGLPTIMSIQ